jgi:putative nucleotidyltransferase with HDIG domain
MNELLKIIEEIEDLEPIQQVAGKMMSIIDDPLSRMDDLAQVILYDQSLTAKILKSCNSAYYALPRKVDSIHEAVRYLGMERIIELLTLKLGWKGLKSEQSGYDLREGELWRNSVASAILARNMAETKQLKERHLLFTAALLKDIGKVVLHRYVGAYSREIDKLLGQGNSFKEAERMIFGIDHTEVGGLIAEKWHFSPRMVELIRNHHLDNGWDDKDPCPAILYLSDTLCMMMGLGIGFDGLAYRFQRRAIESLNFTERDIQGMIARFADKLQEIEGLLQ